MDVSIHASAQEATFVAISPHRRLKFQSTPPRRRRPPPLFQTPVPFPFQSTPPRRRRHGSSRSRPRRSGFNPRLRAGGDDDAVFLSTSTCQFQSTPPRRRRQPAVITSPHEFLFQSTPPRRRRPFVKLIAIAFDAKFQSTPPRRRRLRRAQAQ